LTIDEATRLARAALLACGSSEEAADLLARAMVDAQARGFASVGLSHLLDYCDGLTRGRINGRANPVVSSPLPAVLRVDGDGGIPHLGFERAFEALLERTTTYGVAAFLSHNAFTCAALGYFTRRLAERDKLALAATNAGPALMAASGTARPVFCTNPLSFAAPREGAPPLVIDQSSSATAFVSIQEAARAGRAIPQGWALDAGGNPTTDAGAALGGTLLPAGGARGANLALMVELLAAGLGGACWSVDAPSAFEGDRSPATGLFVLALEPAAAGGDTSARISAYLARLAGEYGAYVPGERSEAAAHRAREEGVRVRPGTVAQLRAYAAGSRE
jgi:(2R)-3-sulfolactate dehydrogenase (NADP+)